MDDFYLNYAETTGPLYRVGVMISADPVTSDMEEAANEWAKEFVGTDVEPIFTDKFEWGFEVVFENAYL